MMDIIGMYGCINQLLYFQGSKKQSVYAEGGKTNQTAFYYSAKTGIQTLIHHFNF